MRPKTSLQALLLSCIALLVAATGCGNDSDSQAPVPTSTATLQPTPTSTATLQPTPTSTATLQPTQTSTPTTQAAVIVFNGEANRLNAYTASSSGFVKQTVVQNHAQDPNG